MPLWLVQGIRTTAEGMEEEAAVEEEEDPDPDLEQCLGRGRYMRGTHLAAPTALNTLTLQVGRP